MTDDRNQVGHIPENLVCPDCGEQMSVDGVEAWKATPPTCFFCGSKMPDAEQWFRCTPDALSPHGYDEDSSVGDWPCTTCGMEMTLYYDPDTNAILVDADGMDGVALRAWKEAQAQVPPDTRDRARVVGTLARRLAEQEWDKSAMW